MKTIEEKAKAYDEALEKARQLCAYPTSKPFISDLQDLFPELKESEGRIRANIIATIHLYYGEPLEDEAKEMIAWLEKQDETFTKKDVDDAYLKGVCDAKQELEKQSKKKPVELEEPNFFDDFRHSDCEQKEEWSEEDEEIQKALIEYLGSSQPLSVDLAEAVSWINSIKDRVQPQKQWKPSDEQMKALTFACIKNAGIDKSSIKALYDLKEQLKKLKG